MFQRLKNWFKPKVVENSFLENTLKDLLILVENQNLLIRGLNFAIQELQGLNEDLNTMACSLMLDTGTTDKTIDKEVIKSLREEKMELQYIFNPEGNIRAWIEKNKDDDLMEEKN